MFTKSLGNRIRGTIASAFLGTPFAGAASADALYQNHRAELATPPPAPCAMSPTPEQAATYIDYVKNQAAPQDPPTPPYYVALAAHIVRASNGTGGLPLARYEQAVADANAHFAPSGIVFYTKGDIDYIDSDFYYDHVDTIAEIDDLRTQNLVANAINVYFTSGAFPYCGISAFTFSATQSILLNNACVATSGAYGNHSTFSHEIGHYFDLFHTHEPAFGLEYVSGTNCADAGDLICDTPADPSLTGVVDINCHYIGSAMDPQGAAYAPDPFQLMSYGPKYCRQEFSPQSVARVVQTLVTGRQSLLSSPVSVSTLDSERAGGVSLSTPWPNPASDLTEMSVSMPVAANVDVTVYDVRGARVRTIAHRLYEPGEHVVGWDGRDTSGALAAPGAYFARLTSGDVVQTRKIVRR